MIRRLAAWLPGHAHPWQARCTLTLLALGTLGTWMACDISALLAPAPSTAGPSSPQTGDQEAPATPDAVLASPSPTASAAPTNLPPGEPTFTSTALPRPTLTPVPAATASRPPPTPQPTLRPLPSPTPAPAAPSVSVYTGQVTLLTYPYRRFLRQERDAVYGTTILRLDRAAYEAAAPSPTPQNYQTLVVENPYLRLTFLPELGGRLYSAVLKATNQEIFYHNPVVKPSHYGPLLPVEDNWWLAVGGMEWAFPVQEHGYAWGLSWTCTPDATPQGVTVTLRDSTDAGQVHAEVRITLAANRAAFSVQPRLINGAERILPVQFWLSAALAPGGPSIEPDTRIILPVSQVLVHSRGENGWQLPGPRAPMPWPVVAGYNLSRYDQWADYLGFFIPYMQANFMAVYNPGADVGAARLVAPGQVPGHKFFAFGPRFGDRSYTDDGSQYVEIWGGANPSFWPEDDVQLAPGAALEWSESWWPLAGLGGLTFANQEVAFNLINDARLRILSVQPRQVTLVLRDEGGEIARVPMELSPTQPVEWTMPATAGPSMRVQFVAANGDMLAEYPIWQQPAETLP